MEVSHIVPVILAGGIGSRLWPLSRVTWPKQFQALMGERTLFQQTVRRVSDREIFTAPIVVTAEEHCRLAQQQLEELGAHGARIIAEPEVRNTAPAITLAALTAANDHDDAHILVLPSDHVVEDERELLTAVARAFELSQNEPRLFTFGIRPAAPETGYGYIWRNDTPFAEGAFALRAFREKPPMADAQTYMCSGEHYWNSGIFLFPVQLYLDELARHTDRMLEACRRALKEAKHDGPFVFPDAASFRPCEKISVDYAVMEKTDKAAVVPVDPGWSDVGSWAALWQASDRDCDGNALVGNVVAMEVKDSYVRSDRRLVAVAGLDQVVVVATADAVLVTSKARAQDIRSLGSLIDQREGGPDSRGPVVRPWGTFCTIDRGDGFQVKRITVWPGQKLSLQYHHHRSEHWTVVAGTAEVTVDNDVRLLRANESVVVPLGAVHRLENVGVGLLELIEVQCGSYLGEDDIVRLSDSYGRGMPSLAHGLTRLRRTRRAKQATRTTSGDGTPAR